MSSWIHFVDPRRPDLADEDETRPIMESCPAIAGSPVLAELRRPRISLRRGPG